MLSICKNKSKDLPKMFRSKISNSFSKMLTPCLISHNLPIASFVNSI